MATFARDFISKSSKLAKSVRTRSSGKKWRRSQSNGSKKTSEENNSSDESGGENADSWTVGADDDANDSAVTFSSYVPLELEISDFMNIIPPKAIEPEILPQKPVRRKKILKDLMSAQETIKRLEQQLRELQLAKEELDRQQRELEELTRRLRDEKEMEAAEKDRLHEEIRRREAEVAHIQAEVQRKDEETRRLQEEVELARLVQHEATEKMLAVSTEQLQHNRAHNVFETYERDDESIHNGHHHHSTMLQEGENDSGSERNSEKNSSSFIGADLAGDLNAPQYELNREVATEKNLSVKTKLEMLKLSLAQENIHKTPQDVQYERLTQAGQTKYKTLTQIREGSARRRIDQFENL